MDLEGPMLSEISQAEKANTVGSHLYVEFVKTKQTKQTGSQVQRTGGWLPEGRRVREWVKK